jgi:hypothetical protein
MLLYKDRLKTFARGLLNPGLFGTPSCNTGSRVSGLSFQKGLMARAIALMLSDSITKMAIAFIHVGIRFQIIMYPIATVHQGIKRKNLLLIPQNDSFVFIG